MFMFCSYRRFLTPEDAMDNRLNKIRIEMKILREDMLLAGDVARNEVARHQDCTHSALRQIEMRAKMAALVREWSVLGGSVNLPTVEEGLKERREPLVRPMRCAPRQKFPLQRMAKRLGSARA
jgi:hypothetical protein